MTLVKICGLTRRTDALHAEAVGANYLGTILAGGPRQLDMARAREVLGPRRAGIRRVAVFGDRPLDELRRQADELDLDVLQLHGDPSIEMVRSLCVTMDRAIWPVLRVEGQALPAEADDLADVAGALVLDAKVLGRLGGTGVALDWAGLADGIARFRERHPSSMLVLAGGLRAENVMRAMALLQPDVVDVSSGVETAPGEKDPMAVERFVSAVSAAKESRR